MKRQTIIALGVAIILGLVAVLLANTYLTGRERQIAQTDQAMVRVAVASLPFEFGSEVTPDKVKFVQYPAASLPPGAFKSLPELLPAGQRRVALRPIQVNQPLLAADLSGEGQNASIAALLPDGMRAATVRINDVSGVAGFVKANDTVDVLITRAVGGTQGAQGGQQQTDVLLQNIRVVAMDQDAAGADGKPVVSRTATLEVTPVDAQKLALGQQIGQLSLVLRKPGAEQNIAAVDTVSLSDLRYSYYSSLPPGASTAAPQTGAPTTTAARRERVAKLTQPRRQPPRQSASRSPPAAPKTTTIEVTRGTETKDYEVGGYDR
ncbi:Flp pilus assembly protein CpaB [Sphingomonas xanthus]|nr:Flp pilus assembly protein CpaB [Sphingomonas xanthus]